MAVFGDINSISISNGNNFRLKITDGTTGLSSVEGFLLIQGTTYQFSTDSEGYSQWYFVDPAGDLSITGQVNQTQNFAAQLIDVTFTQPEQTHEIILAIFIKKYNFLTTKPAKREHIETQKNDFVYCLFRVNSVPTFTLNITYTDESVSSEEIPTSTFNQGETYSIKIDFQNLKQLNQSKVIKKIVLSGELNQDTITYIFTPCKTSNPATIYYQNSLGGFDALYCEGKVLKNIRYNSVISEKSIPSNFPKNFTQSETKNNISSTLYQFNTGFKPKEEIEALADMFHNNKIYLLDETGISDTLIPLLITGNSQAITDSDRNLQAISFQAIETLNKPYND